MSSLAARFLLHRDYFVATQETSTINPEGAYPFLFIATAAPFLADFTGFVCLDDKFFDLPSICFRTRTGANLTIAVYNGPMFWGELVATKAKRYSFSFEGDLLGVSPLVSSKRACVRHASCTLPFLMQ